jgi:hypothetical protein
MIERARTRIGSAASARLMMTVLCALVLCALVLVAAIRTVSADETVMLSLTLKDQKFEPVELHAPPGKPIAIRVKNLNPIASEFESSDLHFEKIVPPGTEAEVHVRPLQPGRYNFYDDFHHETQGFLIVP